MNLASKLPDLERSNLANIFDPNQTFGWLFGVLFVSKLFNTQSIVLPKVEGLCAFECKRKQNIAHAQNEALEGSYSTTKCVQFIFEQN